MSGTNNDLYIVSRYRYSLVSVEYQLSIIIINNYQSTAIDLVKTDHVASHA